MAAETETFSFKIDNDEYEIPSLDDLDMDEWQIVYDYSGLVLDDFAPRFDKDGEIDEEAEAARKKRLGHPGFTRAMLHIGYRRANPNVKENMVREITGKAKLIRVLEAAGEDAGDDVDPPALTTEPEESSPRSSVGSTESSSTTSPAASDQPASDREPITTA